MMFKISNQQKCTGIIGEVLFSVLMAIEILINPPIQLVLLFPFTTNANLALFYFNLINGASLIGRSSVPKIAY